MVNLGFDFKWLGGDTAVRQVHVSTNGQINIRSDDSGVNCCVADPISVYGGPRIAVAQADLNPTQSGDLAILIKTGSVVFSWEQVNFFEMWER